jgi:hypothetical protein
MRAAEDRGRERATLLARDPASQVRLDSALGAGWLLRELREAGAAEQAALLAGRAAAHVSLHDPSAVVELLREVPKCLFDMSQVILAR